MGRRARQHGGVSDLLWDDVKCFFDPDLMGSLPDVRVPHASVEVWQAVLDLLAEKGWTSSRLARTPSASRDSSPFSTGGALVVAIAGERKGGGDADGGESSDAGVLHGEVFHLASLTRAFMPWKPPDLHVRAFLDLSWSCGLV
ncbi:hypothetical protein [Streptomyces sp. NBC_00401]|uniref:hypothetical protein n=1 Tax=Streptomyces sp. NBC_00401 TaxID=2975738 RepID=UPI00224D5DE8|nr:hypothetical protein [Streptomyces sp. NBC_00401]MCX5085637.1 hypothetical protein [Streptomyces sp. NBC_00401]